MGLRQKTRDYQQPSGYPTPPQNPLCKMYYLRHFRGQFIAYDQLSARVFPMARPQGNRILSR